MAHVELKDGDIILYKFKGFIPKVISFFTRSKWSHVSIVTSDKADGRISIVEANMGRNAVTETHSMTFHKAEEIVVLSAPTMTTGEKIMLRRVINKYVGMKYEHSIVQFLKFVIPGLKNKPRTETMLYCSELVKMILKDLPKLIDSNKFDAFNKVISGRYPVSPADFADEYSPIHMVLTNLCGYTISDPISISSHKKTSKK